MPSRIIYACFFILIAGNAFAASPIEAAKPVAIIYFNDGSAIQKEHAQMIGGMVKEANNDFHLSIQEYPLKREEELSAEVEKIADDGVGLIIIVEPHNMDALVKIPGLYPDIDFSIVGAKSPLYVTNARAMIFKEQEGAYMMGVLAALRTKAGAVTFMSSEDNDFTRTLAYAFQQGAKRGNADVHVTQQLGAGAHTKTLKIDDSASDIVYVLDDALLDAALQDAAIHKRLLITYNHDLTNAYPALVITSLLKHYDLAIYHTLRSYSHGVWKPGSQSMGIGDGFLDYVLNSSNKALLPKETIEQLEVTKDFVSQGAVQIQALGK